MNELYWTWGMSKDKTQWYFKVEDLDTGRYAMAYYSTDDEEPLRWYESLDNDLLKIVIETENTDAFLEAKNKKNMLMDISHLRDATIANFM